MQIPLIDHHGFSNAYTENGIPAFQAVADFPRPRLATGLKLDIQLIGDGRLIVFHDRDLSRLHNHNAVIGRSSYAHLLDCLCAGGNPHPL